MPKVLVSRLFHETHSFVDDLTTLEHFAAVPQCRIDDASHDSSPLGGALKTFHELGWIIVPGPDYTATPSGVVCQEVFEKYWGELQASWTTDLDAIFLILHGAMVTESLTDVEGELLRRVRALPSGAKPPLFGVLDLHANASAEMAEQSNALLSYRENPHVDAWQTACRCVHLLDRSLSSGQPLFTSHRHSGVILPPIATATAEDPMRSLLELARQLESEHPWIAAINVNAGFAFADTPDTGLSFQVIGREPALAGEILDRLCERADQLRLVGDSPEQPLAEVMQTLRQTPLLGLTVLVEVSDNIGAGSPGDMTHVLRGLIEHRLENAAICINDPRAVRRLQEIPLGNTALLEIGGVGSRYDLGPLELEVTLVSRSDGHFRLEDKQSHLASMVGDRFAMGPCAVVRHGGVEILLTSNKTPPFDLAQWRSQGIEPSEKSIVVVKSAVAHRKAYDGIAARYIALDTPGPCRSDLTQFDYRHARSAKPASR